MKRVSVVAILAVFLMVSMVSAKNLVTFGEPVKVSDNEIMVPMQVYHEQDIAAMDIPLEWTPGVTLTDVTFTERVNYFDAKLANIKEADNQVLIGLIAMVYERKPALSKAVAGDPTVANLTFRIDDLSLESFEISPFTQDVPSHELNLVYNDWSDGTPVVSTISPEFTGGTISWAAQKAVPDAFEVGQNYPNPFNPSTEIAYALPEGANVNVEVYNILGQRVKTLINEFQDAGNYTVTWNGDDEYGSTVASGVYFYRVTAGQYKDIKKMVMMK